jgi:predicted nicotinamide N-methyase
VPKARTDPRLARFPLRRLRLPTALGTLSIVLPRGAEWAQRPEHQGSAGGSDEPPYWADLWPASIAIARWLARRRDLAGRAVLDLGCGLGLPGTAAAARGAAVTFADRSADALAFAAFHARENGAVTEPRCIVHDWHRDAIAGPFDFVLLADVSYRPLHHAPILRQLHGGLAARGVAIHADPFRRESEGFLVQLKRQFAVRGLATEVHFEEARRPVRLVFAAREVGVLDEWVEVPPAQDRDRPQDPDADRSR